MIQGFRRTLLATASALALAAVAQTARAQVAPTPHSDFAADHWTVWVEGGPNRATGGPLKFGEAVKAGGFKLGGDGAVGFSFRPTASRWTLNGEFRYGAVNGRQGFTTDGTFGSNSAVPATGSAKTREDHWLADFDVGRDVDIGAAFAEVEGGLRIASIEATTRARASYLVPGSGGGSGGASGPGCSGGASSPGGPSGGGPSCPSGGPGTPSTPGAFTLKQTSQFVGAGPRIGLKTVVPIDRRWAVEGGVGAAELIGNGGLKVSTSGGAGNFAINALNTSRTTAVFNLDGHMGLDLKMSPSAMLTVGYRVDSYYGAVRTADPGGHIANRDRYYAGPMLRLTISG